MIDYVSRKPRETDLDLAADFHRGLHTRPVSVFRILTHWLPLVVIWTCCCDTKYLCFIASFTWPPNATAGSADRKILFLSQKSNLWCVKLPEIEYVLYKEK